MNEREFEYYDPNDPRFISAKRERLRNRITHIFIVGLAFGYFIIRFISIEVHFPALLIYYLLFAIPFFIIAGIYYLRYARFSHNFTDKEVVCRKCDYPLCDLKHADICPECGADLTQHSAISLTQHMGAGAQLMMASGAWVVAIGCAWKAWSLLFP